MRKNGLPLTLRGAGKPARPPTVCTNRTLQPHVVPPSPVDVPQLVNTVGSPESSRGEPLLEPRELLVDGCSVQRMARVIPTHARARRRRPHDRLQGTLRDDLVAKSVLE